MEDKKISLGKLVFVNLYSEKYEEAKKFYTEILGLNPFPDNKGNWFGFQTGETTFALEPQSNRKKYDYEFNKENPILLQWCLPSVEELKRVTQALEEKGVKVKQKIVQKSYGTVTTFLDPDDNLIELLVKKENED